MASRVRLRFAIDEKVLSDQHLNQSDVLALREVKRKTKLDRWDARRRNTVFNTPIWNGFECGTRKEKKGVSKLSMLTADNLIDIITYWKTHKPTMKYLSS